MTAGEQAIAELQAAWAARNAAEDLAFRSTPEYAERNAAAMAGMAEVARIEAQRQQTIADAKAYEARMRSTYPETPGYITFDTPGVDLSKTYFKGADPITVTEESRMAGFDTLPSGMALPSTGPGVGPVAPSGGLIEWGIDILKGGDCPPGTKKELGVGPGGGWLTQCTPIGGTDPVIGSPKVSPGATGSLPATATSTRRKCGKGPSGRMMVLNIDGLCEDLPPRSNRRLYKAPPKPLLTGSERKAIRIAARMKDKLIRATKDAGAFAAKNAPKQARKGRPIVTGRGDDTIIVGR